jgi:hypothetical protein
LPHIGELLRKPGGELIVDIVHGHEI